MSYATKTPMLPILRILLRRSKEEGQEGSLDTQRAVCIRWAEANGYGALARKEYADDGIAGDDFVARHKLHTLLAEVQRGDIVVCLDQTRLGRKMVECLGVVKEINEAGARLFYATSGQEVLASNAIEQFTVLAQGFGAQQEKEMNQQRTRDALREKVRRGEIGGGRCFGYTNKQSPTGDARGKGRKNTRAVINEEQATVVRSIFDMYLDGKGLGHIAKALNHDRIPSPDSGTKRGTGSWSPGSIREMLRRERYHGVYVHGQTIRTRKGGKRLASKADPADVIRVDMPDWQIIDDETWYSVQEQIAKRATNSFANRPATKHALSGIARCAHCGGSIGITNTKRAGGRIRAYTCTFHAKRGSTVCPVKIRQDQDEVEDAMAEYLQRVVLTPLMEATLAAVREEVESELAAPPEDTSAIEGKIAELRSQLKRLAKAIALTIGGDEIITEYQSRLAQVQALELDLAAARRTPKMLTDMMEKVERIARTKVAGMRATLAADPAGARDVYKALFPEGLTFDTIQQGSRRVWLIEGVARLDGCSLSSDPTGSLAKEHPSIPVSFPALRAA